MRKLIIVVSGAIAGIAVAALVAEPAFAICIPS